MEDSGITIQEMEPTVVAAIDKELEKILPIVKSHGGGVELVSATTDEVVLKLSGHCVGCNMAKITYDRVLNKLIRDALPELKEIRYV
jgi:Fe-S cluster biogenesis protein NfuA